ncbi:hypothetical protein MMU07_14200 [Aquiflexum sp. LQ15W]|uniref:hypothetical protein n=1 Tax=Cognataquiflexum nitidum TaxID=2922272 RepID=UPI001F134ECA|nr:hypothetical protein [Cognataquiflexum nitidum]MCH6200733.1 hypothetical protein [Cognataquiflexum nitidum]
MKKNIYQILREVSTVIVGILIALFINTWNEERKEKIYLNQIFKSIELELTESEEEIEYNIPKQQTLIDSLKHYTSDKEMSILRIYEKVGGFYAPNIRTNSWTSISTSKIELVKYDKLSILNDLVEGKELLKNKLNYLQTLSYSHLNDTSEETKTQMMLLLMDIVSTEKSLKQIIEKYKSL